MQTPPIPENELGRLEALRSYEILDTEAEQAFDDLTAVAAHVLDVPIALVSLVDEDRQFFKSKHGLAASETSRDVSFCAHAILKPDEVMVVPDASADERFADNPLVTGELGIRFYAGTPLVDNDGNALGSLCTIDQKPREVTPEQIGALQKLGRLAMSQMNMRIRQRELTRLYDELAQTQQALRESEARQALIMETALDAVITMDDSGRITGWNKQAEALFGWTREGAVGRMLSETIVPPAFREMHARGLAKFLKTGEGPVLNKRVEVLALHRDGHTFDAELAIVPLRVEGGVSFSAFVRDVTEQRRVTRALRDSEERFGRIAANVPGLIYRCENVPDQPPRFTYVSDGCRELFGIEAAAVLADSDQLNGRIHPADLPSLIAEGKRAAETATPLVWTGRHLPDVTPGADAQPLDAGRRVQWINLVARPTVDQKGQVVTDGVVFDVTAAKERERDLRRLSLVAASADSAAIVADRNGHIEWVNPAFERLTGHAMAEVIGKKPGNLLQGKDTDPATVAHMRQCVARGEGFAVEIVNYAKDGRPYWLDLEVRPARDPITGELTNFIAIERDITAAKETDRQLRAAKDEADRANCAKSDFLANMSHEIRTPLGAVIGFGDLLLDDLSRPTAAEEAGERDAAADERRGWTETIRGSAKHLLALINDVLDLSKIESGKMEFEDMDCSPHDLLGEVVSIMRVPAAKKGLNLSLQYLTPIPATIRSDPTRLKQVVFNLVNNAVKFTESGGVRLLVSCDAAGGEPRLTVHVNDTGVGIPADKLGKLFAPFTQADSSVTRKFGGTGLGLCISRHICRGLGGDVTVSTQEGIGSTFTVKVSTGDLDGVRMLPRETSEALLHDESPMRRATDAPPARLKPAAAASIARRVLVADDGETNRKLINLLLTRAGVEVVEAGDGAAALKLLRDGLDVDLVLMDMQMPVMDGYTAVAALREAGLTLPVIALTAHAMSGDRDRCLSVGCDDYLTKPIDRNKLLAAVAHWAKSNSEAAARVADDTAPLTSELPMDDADFVEIAADFVARAAERLAEFESALADGDAARLKELGHWLRGVGGSAGYPQIAARAGVIEQAAPRLGDDATAALVGREIGAVRTLLARASAALPTAALAA